MSIVSHAHRGSSVAAMGSPPLTTRLRALAAEVSKFGTVGVMAFAIDMGLFNLLRFLWQDSPLADKPLTSRAISSVAATTFAYFGNRLWTWRHAASTSVGREYAAFFLINGAALLLGFLCLGFSNYVLGLHSPLADNTANVISIVAGTGLRFWAYRRYVFTSESRTHP